MLLSAGIYRISQTGLCQKQVGGFLLELLWCGWHVISITPPPAPPCSQHVAQRGKDCLCYPFMWNSSSVVSRSAPDPNPSRCGLTLHCAQIASILWGRINNTSAFKYTISSAQFHQNEAASLHATAHSAVLWADRINVSQRLVSTAIKGWP